ncbi:glycosyltransferase family 39 protein [Quadrisphaera setariae]|uniref:Glycosyltransferase family 39 protein n=1 Tax=Quadrisphaera setariae TaxID=2593304 RepID=A0A5C8ZK18_9ACTN|nr:glycosyltransferase family 39 protein [Quadrisphaera setariae]TXR57964.1 glycosyltransferase family 39 protein [Quadrisphaera setariae]
MTFSYSAASAARADVPAPPAAGTPAARWWRGREQDPAWARPALLVLLAGTALLYLWDLSESGWANAFYSAAALAGSRSWEAFFFGSSDAGNSITVDKPPASLWVVALSVRLFGLSSWSLLVPQALMGVAAVWLLHGSVRRVAGAPAGLLAGAALAVTPVAALMFRFNNPDALLVLLMTGAAVAVLRAVESARTSAQTRWLVLAGALVGLGFLTKQLQVLLVVPAFGVAHLLAGRARLARRVVQLLVAGLALLVAGGWWVAVVELWPAGSRPYIGGSQDDSFLGLTFGYNGFGRLTGHESGSVGTTVGPTGTGHWGDTGFLRLLGTTFAGQVTWLVPAAVVLGVVALWLLRSAARTSPLRAALVLWGTWLGTTWLVFSYMSGIFHPYYTVALAPAIAAVVGLGAAAVWRVRATWLGAVALALATALTAGWAFVLLTRSPEYYPALKWLVLVVGLAAAGGFVALRALPELPRLARTAALSAVGAAVVASLAAPTAYAVDTAGYGHTGSLPSAGPAVTGGLGAGLAGPGGFGRPGHGSWGTGGHTGGGWSGRAGGHGGAQPGQAAPFGQAPPWAQALPQLGGAGGSGGHGGTGGGPAGGLLSAARPGPSLVRLLEQDAGRYRWVAAAIGSQNAAGYQLATQDPVMPVGGFNGTDPSPTLAQFQRYVADGDIHYFIASATEGGSLGAGGTERDSTQVRTWVEAHFTSRVVDGVTVYDLTSPAAPVTASSDAPGSATA